MVNSLHANTCMSSMRPPCDPWLVECVCATPSTHDVQWTASTASPIATLDRDAEEGTRALGNESGEADDSLGLAGTMSPSAFLRPGSSALEYKMHQMVSSSGNPFQIDAALLRGVSLRSTLRGLGWIWRLRPEGMTDRTWWRLWQTTHSVCAYDVFISHTWKTSGTEKLLALLLSTGCSRFACGFFLWQLQW